MALSSADWIPPGAWLAPGYAEWAPPAALRGAVACLWASVVADGADRAALVLPDACSDLIWEQGVGGYLAGPDTGPVRTVTETSAFRWRTCCQPPRDGSPRRSARLRPPRGRWTRSARSSPTARPTTP